MVRLFHIWHLVNQYKILVCETYRNGSKFGQVINFFKLTLNPRGEGYCLKVLRLRYIIHEVVGCYYYPDLPMPPVFRVSE